MSQPLMGSEQVKAFWEDSHITIWNKSCTDMSELPDNSIQACVTSPPYWGLRKYAGDQDIPEWGCAYGLEPTVDLYVQHSIEILREIRRVLRKDGVVFWNLGDSYAGGKGQSGQPMSADEQEARAVNGYSINRGHDQMEMATRPSDNMAGLRVCNLKPKDLCLIPFRVALAAQADGWWVRSVIIWNKNNPMPESVRDRPTESHEYILMLTKSANYYWDMEAVREANSPLTDWNDRPETSGDKADEFIRPNSGPNRGICFKSHFSTNGRNLRSVWTFSTQPYPEAHFATFPEKLPELCIKAATPEYGCCDKCGTPYERVVEPSEEYRQKLATTSESWFQRKESPFLPGRKQDNTYHGISADYKTLGWRQACKCQDSKPVPSTVLDPFAGSGTTLWVAKKLGRKSVGYELSEEYCNLIIERNRQQALELTP